MARDDAPKRGCSQAPAFGIAGHVGRPDRGLDVAVPRVAAMLPPDARKSPYPSSALAHRETPMTLTHDCDGTR